MALAMGFFGRIFGAGRARPVPRWARDLGDRARFDAFVDAVVAFLDRTHDPSDAERVATGSVMITDRAKRRAEWILHEAASECAEADPVRWPAILADERRRAAGSKKAERVDFAAAAALSALADAGSDADKLQVFGLAADGTQRIVAGAMQVELNRPRAEADGVAIDDPLEVARAVLQHHHRLPLHGRLELGFVEACWLLTRRGQPGRAPRPPARRALAELTAAAAAGDISGALAIAARSDEAASVAGHLEAVLARRWPNQLAEHLLERRAEPGLLLMEALAPGASVRCLRLLDAVRDRGWARELTLTALLAALDAGAPASALAQRWHATRAPDDFDWLEAELRRLVRGDLDQASALYERIAAERRPAAPTREAFFARLARADPASALARAAVPDNPCGTDELPNLLGCHRGGADVRPVLEVYIDSLNAHAYAPYQHYAGLVELCLLLEAPDLLARSLDRAGASSWQVASACRPAIARLAARGSAALPALLEVCRSLRPVGVVAGRDASDGGFHAGMMVLRPAWLDFTRPRPVDTLLVSAALAGDGPDWEPRAPLP